MLKVFYPRKIYPEIKEHLNNRQITVLTGMRRSGKTTLVEHLFSEIDSPNKQFLDLQKLSNRELFSQKNYDNIILNLQRQGLNITERLYLGLDEIQLLPDIVGVIKYLYDHYDIKFIVTGSSSYYLKNLFTESLAGRKKIFELFPLDFGEFLAFKQTSFSKTNFLIEKFNLNEYERLKEFYEEYVQFGGFPEVALTAMTKDKTDILNDIIDSYLKIDVKTLSDFHEIGNIYNLVKMLASRVGNKLDYMKISRLSGMSRATTLNYIDLFEQTYLIYRVPVYTNSPDREIVKAQKLYFADTGLLSILAEIDSGVKFENAVFSQLHRHGTIRYYGLKTGREIDFIFNNNIAIEAKERPTTTDNKELKDLASIAGIEKCRLVGRYNVPQFDDYIWGGEIK